MKRRNKGFTLAELLSMMAQMIVTMENYGVQMEPLQ